MNESSSLAPLVKLSSSCLWGGDTRGRVYLERLEILIPISIEAAFSTLNYKCTRHLCLEITRFEMNNKIWKHSEGLILDDYSGCHLTRLCLRFMFYDESTLPSVQRENRDKCKHLTWMCHPRGSLFILLVLTFRLTLISHSRNYIRSNCCQEFLTASRSLGFEKALRWT